MVRRLAALLTALIWILAEPAAAEKRVALVVGNAAYAHTAPLANPANDARSIAATLATAGFQVIKVENADRRALDGALRKFTEELTDADVGLFFYAGHGLQVGAQNYLVPIDAKLERERDLEFEVMRLDFVLRQMEIEREGKTSIVILDACRDNPLTRTLARSMGSRSAAIGRGLAAPAAGVGTFIAFATQPGNVALDGDGGNSPFTASLARQIKIKGRNLPATMIAVRNDVIAATGGKQVPWDHSALTGDFYFLPGEGGAPGTVAAAPAGSASDIAALQARLAKLEAEAKEREAAKSAPAAAQLADAMKLAELRKRASDLDELVKSLGRKLAGDAAGSIKLPSAADAEAIRSEIARRSADLVRLKAEISGLEGEKPASQSASAALPPVVTMARPPKYSAEFEEADNVSIKGSNIATFKAASPVACRTECEKNSACIAFQHGKKIANMGQCELFAAVDARSADQSWRSGVRRAETLAKVRLSGVVTPTQRGFVTARGQLLQGQVIKEARSDGIAGCLVTCFNTPGCIAAAHDPSQASSCTVLRSVTQTIERDSATAIVHGDLVQR